MDSDHHHHDDKLLPPQPRRLIICCDGTWQNSATDELNVPSNVTRMCRSLAKAGLGTDGRVWQQVIYYDAGVGTGALSDAEKKRQGGVGDGLNHNVCEAYNFIVNNYTAGDEICAFGFSRGAYTARALVGLVAQIGVLDPTLMVNFPSIYKIYKMNTSGGPLKEFPQWIEYKNSTKPDSTSTLPENVKIKVVGVWDTVGSLGIPDIQHFDFSWFRKEHGFHNTAIHPQIENAFQALALDERRGPFAPSVWYVPSEKDSRKKKGKPKTNLLQVWFPGVHINIGGGSDDCLKARQGDLEEIANLTFAWMVDRCSPLLAFDCDAIDLQVDEHHWLMGDHVRGKEPGHLIRDPTSITDQSWGQWFKAKLFNAPKEEAKREVGWATGKIVDSFGGIMAAAGQKIRTPGEYRSTDPERTLLNHLGSTNEQLHPSVWHRFNATRGDADKHDDYNPLALEGFERRVRTGAAGHEWVKGTKAPVVLPEFIIPYDRDTDSMERRLMKSSVAAKYLNELDTDNRIKK
ncbi:MAG: hypothetical protein M4579_000026 [Chaenotheca gracillima]|nr:MAG: hypothetical protein M4579_000026 [Chaenotheca gracillima]